MKKSIAATLLAITVLILTACGSGDNDIKQADSHVSTTTEETVPATILYSRAAEQVGLWVAKDRGFFEKNGLDVTLQEAARANQIPAAISGGSAQMGFETGPDFLSAVAAGVKMVVVSGLSIDTATNPRVALIAAKNSGITKPADIVGKRIAIPGPNSSTDLSTIRQLQMRGIETNKIKWVAMPFQQYADAFTAGRVDAAVAVHPFIGLLEKMGHVSIISNYASGNEKQLVVFLSGDASWAKNNPNAVAAIRRSLDEANQFIQSNPDKTRAIMEKYTGLKPAIINSIPMPTLSTDVSVDQLQFFLDMMEQRNLIKKDLDLTALIAE